MEEQTENEVELKVDLDFEIRQLQRMRDELKALVEHLHMDVSVHKTLVDLKVAKEKLKLAQQDYADLSAKQRKTAEDIWKNKKQNRRWLNVVNLLKKLMDEPEQYNERNDIRED